MHKRSDKLKMLITGYSDFTLTQAGVRSNLDPMVNHGVYFKIKNDIRSIFPYINAEIEGAIFFDNPQYIQFMFEMSKCTVYPFEVIAVPFANEKHALEFIDKLINFFNDLYARKNSIQPDYKKVQSVSVLDIFKLLPGTNCRECGFTTCMAFAAALTQSKTGPDKCPYFAKPISENAIYPVYDKDGNLISTVSIEIGSEKEVRKNKDQKKKISLKVASSGIQADLTSRELEVLCFVAKGATNTEISRKLSISHHTVKSHVVHIFNKLGVNDRTQAAVWAAQNKIL